MAKTDVSQILTFFKNGICQQLPNFDVFDPFSKNGKDAFLYKCCEKFLDEKKKEQKKKKMTKFEKFSEILILGLWSLVWKVGVFTLSPVRVDTLL